MSTKLINRTGELARLRELASVSSQKLVLMTGPRRVGKTFLLNNAWQPGDYFLFTASRTSPEINRKQLVRDLARWSEEDLRPEDYPTWRSVFDLIWRVRSSEPLVVVLDEFQYLGAGEDGLGASHRDPGRVPVLGGWRQGTGRGS